MKIATCVPLLLILLATARPREEHVPPSQDTSTVSIDLPISASAVACQPDRLSLEQFEERRRLVDELLPCITARTEEDHGLQVRFDATGDTAEKLLRWIMLERRCCPFLTFALVAHPDDGPLTLTITGPEGTKPFLIEALGDDARE